MFLLMWWIIPKFLLVCFSWAERARWGQICLPQEVQEEGLLLQEDQEVRLEEAQEGQVPQVNQQT